MDVYFCWISLLISINYAQNNISTTTFMTTQAPQATVPPLVIEFLETATGNKANLSAEYCEWNVSNLISLINETNPEFLYTQSSIDLLTTYIPTYVINQFPPNLLSFYGINYTNVSNEDCNSGASATMPAFNIDLCIGPLIHTDLENPVSTGDPVSINLIDITGIDTTIEIPLTECGLSCSSGGEVYGLSDNEQQIVDYFKIVGCSICFVAILFLGISLCFDQKRGGKKFYQKPILQILPYLITLSLFSIVFLMTIGEIVGKDTIVCYEHDYGHYPDEPQKEFSFFNPIQGQNIACTIHGLFFYSALNMYQFYTVLLSFIIFRQLYQPMNPLWEIRQRWWHVIVWSIIIILDILSIVMSSYTGVYPMGVCIPGPSVTSELFLFVNLPFLLSGFLCIVLLIGSSVMLRKEVSKQKDVTHQTERIEDLLYRLVYYSIGVIACLILLCVTALMFFFKTESLKTGMRQSIECQLAQILIGDTDCPEREERMSPFFFISWIIAAILGVSSQLILSCHSEARERIRKATTTFDKASFKIVTDKTLTTSSKSGSRSSKRKILIKATSGTDDDTDVDGGDQETSIASTTVPNAFQKGAKGAVSITPSDVNYRTSMSPQDIELETVIEEELTS